MKYLKTLISRGLVNLFYVIKRVVFSNEKPSDLPNFTYFWVSDGVNSVMQKYRFLLSINIPPEESIREDSAVYLYSVHILGDTIERWCQ